MLSDYISLFVINYYKEINNNFFFSFSDPRVKDFLLMSNPFPTIAILTVYLYFILKWGPNYMKDRKPFNLDRLMIVYNIIQIIACCMLLKQVGGNSCNIGYD